jgi:PhoH-like ATPase
MAHNKTFVLDTNIILDNHENIHVLSDGGANLLVLPATVLDEIDTKKNGFDEINFNAREFNRVITDAEVLGTDTNDQFTVVHVKVGEMKIDIVDLMTYHADNSPTAPSIINDRKIIEVAVLANSIYPNVIVISNDVAFRSRTLTKCLKAEPFKRNYKDTTKISFKYTADIDFDVPQIITTEELNKLLREPVANHISSVILTNTTTGRTYVGVRVNGLVEFLDDSSKKLDPDFTQLARPQNVGQKVLAKLILSPFTDVVVVSSPAGSGKNYIATSSACKLMDRDKRYHKIVYIRKTLVSEDKTAELGFLKGGLEEKLSPFLAPMENTIEGFLKSKHKDKKYNKDQLEQDKEEFKKKYPIEYPFAGHMRGTTITNAIVILDEAQNFTLSDVQMLISRIGNDCKLIVLGSLRQIDNPYLNKYNNALAYLLDKTTKDNGDVRLVACELDITVRSKIAEWGDNFC